MTKPNGSSEKNLEQAPAISTLSVAGFKSIVDEQTIEVRPLTLLAGANSSGKSSMLQPLLLLKQTLEAQFDPGPLLLNGPNVKFTSVSQFWRSRFCESNCTQFVVAIGASNKCRFTAAFGWDRKGFAVDQNTYNLGDDSLTIRASSSADDIIKKYYEIVQGKFDSKTVQRHMDSSRFEVSKSRFFIELVQLMKDPLPNNDRFSVPSIFSPRSIAFEGLFRSIMEAIHLPGLRGTPERTYPVTAIGPRFPGTFENYVASIIAHWSTESAGRLRSLNEDLRLLGLTWKVEARRLDDTRVEIQVGRMPSPKKGGAHDLVSIADVGLGVSQTLPVVVAMRAAIPGQFVYIEQPEIHLHPRAQVAMARLLGNAAKRGVRLVVETHSSLLLLAVQTLVAEGVIEPNLVGLNWFLRSEKDGTTRIQSADLDEAGRFGDWPEDFDEVALKSENRYLSAAEARLIPK